MRGASSPPARPISSMAVVDCCEAQYGMECAAHARAAAHSPSGCAARCIATGAMRSGAARLRSPSAGMCVVVSTSETSTMHRGQMVTRENAARFARSVDSVSAPGSVVLGDRGQ